MGTELARSFLAVAIVFVAVNGVCRLAPAQDSARGAVLFQNCVACHGESAEGNATFGAPALAAMSQWYLESQLLKFRNGLRGAHPDDREGLRMRPMSRTLATDEEVRAVAAFLAGLPPARPAPTLTGGDPAKGKILYATCAACHGAGGEGNQVLGGPSLDRTGDWYLLGQLRKYRSGVRGSDVSDPLGVMMRPMAMALSDEQALVDVVAHIMTLSR